MEFISSFCPWKVSWAGLEWNVGSSDGLDFIVKVFRDRWELPRFTGQIKAWKLKMCLWEGGWKKSGFSQRFSPSWKSLFFGGKSLHKSILRVSRAKRAVISFSDLVARAPALGWGLQARDVPVWCLWSHLLQFPCPNGPESFPHADCLPRFSLLSEGEGCHMLGRVGRHEWSSVAQGVGCVRHHWRVSPDSWGPAYVLAPQHLTASWPGLRWTRCGFYPWFAPSLPFTHSST